MSTNRNRIIGSFEDSIEKGQATVKNATKQAASDFASSTKGQLTGSAGQNSSAPADSKGAGTNEQANKAQNQQNPQMSDAERVEFLRNLYGKSDNNAKGAADSKKPQKGAGPVAQALGVPQQDPNAGKTPEEIAKLQALRAQLHQDYYQNTFNRPKPKEEPVTEKIEKEKQMEALVEQKKQKEKPGPLQNVKKGTGEANIGVAG